MQDILGETVPYTRFTKRNKTFYNAKSCCTLHMLKISFCFNLLFIILKSLKLKYETRLTENLNGVGWMLLLNAWIESSVIN